MVAGATVTIPTAFPVKQAYNVFTRKILGLPGNVTDSGAVSRQIHLSGQCRHHVRFWFLMEFSCDSPSGMKHPIKVELRFSHVMSPIQVTSVSGFPRDFRDFPGISPVWKNSGNMELKRPRILFLIPAAAPDGPHPMPPAHLTFAHPSNR
jgi:hypothetical protein